jgi:hypothetical protein
MKENNTLVLLFLIVICSFYSIFFNFNKHFIQANPLEITKLSDKELDKKTNMIINNNDQVSYIKLEVKKR